VDEYIQLRVKQAEAKSASDKVSSYNTARAGVCRQFVFTELRQVKIDPRLERVVMDMFERCFKEGDFKPALGIALEARRPDKVFFFFGSYFSLILLPSYEFPPPPSGTRSKLAT
jgi:hypothetical protein